MANSPILGTQLDEYTIPPKAQLFVAPGRQVLEGCWRPWRPCGWPLEHLPGGGWQGSERGGAGVVARSTVDFSSIFRRFSSLKKGISEPRSLGLSIYGSKVERTLMFFDIFCHK